METLRNLEAKYKNSARAMPVGVACFISALCGFISACLFLILNSPEPSLGCLYSSSLLGFLSFSPIAQPTAVSTVCMVHGRRTSSKTLAAAGMPPPESERRPVMFRLWHLYLPSVRCRV